MESSFQLITAYDMFYYVKFTALSIKTSSNSMAIVTSQLVLETLGMIEQPV